MDTFFRISIIIPTLNSAKTLGLCLGSIAMQDYPKKYVEVIFADGGSQDGTLDIINEFTNNNEEIKVETVENKLKTGEAGKAAALKAATGDIAAFIDSDNILENTSWLTRMVEPFNDIEVIASEPIRYTYRKEDGYITRYCALMGMNDPLCYFLGNYDRECILSGRWTEVPFRLIEDNRGYLKLKLDPTRLPTIGANGFLIRRDELEQLEIGDYLFDIDLLAQILSKDASKTVAKVKIGIVHIFAGRLKDLYRKQKRRICDYKFFFKKRIRCYQWGKLDKKGLIYFCLSCIFLMPLLAQTFRGFLRKKDTCWFIHPVFCWLTLIAYGTGVLFGQGAMLKREGWQA